MKNSCVTIVPIGSSSSGNSMYIRIDDVGFLVDAGVSYRRINKCLRVANIHDIDALFISHTHSDHIAGLSSVIKNIKVPVFGSKQVLESLQDVDNKEVLDFFVRKKTTKDLCVTEIKTYHDKVGSGAFVFEKNTVKLGYLTDTGMINEAMLNALKGCQIVVIEANHDEELLKNGPYPKYLQDRIRGDFGHLSNNQCLEACKLLQHHGTKYFFLAHLSQENNNPVIARQTIESGLDLTRSFVYVLPKYDGNIFCVDVERCEKKTCNKKYHYCLVRLVDNGDKYWYLDKSNSHMKKERVVVPFGKNNKEKIGEIVDVKIYDESDLPYPINKTKTIIDVINTEIGKI